MGIFSDSSREWFGRGLERMFIVSKLLNKKPLTQWHEIEKAKRRKCEDVGSKVPSFLHFCPSDLRLRPYRVAIEALSLCERAFAASR
jgi:hypothetical protein